MLFNIEIEAVQWTGTEKSTRDALILMGQTVDTSTNVAMGKFEDYCLSQRASGTLPVTPMAGYAKLNDWIIKCKNGSLLIMNDIDFKSISTDALKGDK